MIVTLEQLGFERTLQGLYKFLTSSSCITWLLQTRTKVPLKQLRHSLSIIPQEPVIFSDTIRANLDPFGKHTDEELWNALRQVELIDYVESTDKKLEHFLEERGQNFSVGQKQLVCLARALLKRNKILLIDEATANVDPRTDNLIQESSISSKNSFLVSL